MSAPERPSAVFKGRAVGALSFCYDLPMTNSERYDKTLDLLREIDRLLYRYANNEEVPGCLLLARDRLAEYRDLIRPSITEKENPGRED